MKKFLATGVVVLLMLGGASAQEAAKPAAGKMGAGKPAANVSQTLMDMENQWSKASKAGNADALSGMLADDFVTLDSDGSTYTKPDVLARTKKAKWQTSELGDMKVMVHGDSAIVTGSWTGKGTDGGGKAYDGKERWVDTWVNSGGKWRCVASASAPVK
jgi:ketosteroid isomerase-like protein